MYSGETGASEQDLHRRDARRASLQVNEHRKGVVISIVNRKS